MAVPSGRCQRVSDLDGDGDCDLDYFALKAKQAFPGRESDN